ncbi:hypothetical protein THII_0479 [Thioploca ingrica]|uniref:Uncharacterized protein n=1 Tax=Thioploca ingrica TaxID=40754 RepID=A0A090BUA7_9GAMM|nr:hypothetical protein THII_0479 [Thioploca ingrica]
MKVAPPNNNNTFWVSSLFTPKLLQWVHSVKQRFSKWDWFYSGSHFSLSSFTSHRSR